MKSFRVDPGALLTVVAAVVDLRGKLLEANAGFLRLLPARHSDAIGERIDTYFIQPTFATLLEAVNASGSDGYRGLMTIGEARPTSRTLRGRIWRTESGLGVLAEYDIAETERLNDAMMELYRHSELGRDSLARANLALRQRELQIIEMSLTDPLTGVGNRRRLEQALAMEVTRARETGRPFSAIITDVDHFKRVNDSYGHRAGDRVLERLGALLRKETRATDTVARSGGEEFMVLMPDTELAQAELKAERLRQAFSAEIVAPLTGPVTLSFGVGELGDGESGEALLGRVDKALYHAKANGRDNVVAAVFQEREIWKMTASV